MMHLSSNREEQLRTASLLTMPSKEDQRRHRDCAMFAIPQLHLRLRTNDYHFTRSRERVESSCAITPDFSGHVANRSRGRFFPFS